MRPVGGSAPGKALLCGEYAVLEGATAVVSAVDRRVSVQWCERAQAIPPEVAATLELAKQLWGEVPGFLKLDASALQHAQVKLGLGSSAAAAAATAGAVFATHGFDLSPWKSRWRVFECALKGHASIAPGGSGVDVAASCFGGFLRFTRVSAEVDIRPLNPPEGLELRLIWTGHAARTSHFLARLGELRERDSRRYERQIARLTELCSAFAVAFEAGRAQEVIDGAASYAEAMGALGDAAGIPIVEARLRRIAELAAHHRGSAKPSGAGGGDVSIAFFPNADAAHGFERACASEGLRPIDVRWGAAGVCAP